MKRNGAEKLVEVTLQNTYGDTALGVKEEGDLLGIKVSPLSKEDRYRYRLNKGVKITDIRNGKFKSAGLEKGYILVKINNSVLYDEEDLAKALNSVTDGGVFVTAVSPRGRVEYFAFSLLN